MIYSSVPIKNISRNAFGETYQSDVPMVSNKALLADKISLATWFISSSGSPGPFDKEITNLIEKVHSGHQGWHTFIAKLLARLRSIFVLIPRSKRDFSVCIFVSK
jgi:hypothetical protein